MHQCSECSSTEENPYSTSLCKSHQIELQLSLLDEVDKMSRAIISAVGALEMNPLTGDRTALAVLTIALPFAEQATGFKARRAAQPRVQLTGATDDDLSGAEVHAPATDA